MATYFLQKAFIHLLIYTYDRRLKKLHGAKGAKTIFSRFALEFFSVTHCMVNIIKMKRKPKTVVKFHLKEEVFAYFCFFYLSISQVRKTRGFHFVL